MPMAMIHKVGPGDLYSVHFLDRTDPGFGQGGGVDPGYGQGIHRPDRPDQGLPGGGHISNRPPGIRPGGIPDNELPDHAPPQLLPGYTLVMVRNAHGKWEYAAIAPGSPPPRPLPTPPPAVGPGNPNRPDQSLPGGPPAYPDNTLPPAPEPKA